MTSKRNSIPSLTMNKFFVSKRASMFEVCDESPREKRDRSPCGMLEVSERKLKARKEKDKKTAMGHRRKRQADPYAEESTEMEDTDSMQIEKKICGHSNRSVNFGYVKRYLKQSVPVGECVHCTTSKPFSDRNNSESYNPVIWLCAFCGYQGCDRNTGEKHAFRHYKTPRSDPHCIVINTQFFTVWCYECDSEVVDKSSKRLHEVIQYVKRLSERAPKKSVVSQLTVAKPSSTNLTTQYSGSDSRLYTRKSYEEIARSSMTLKHCQANQVSSSSSSSSLTKVKGINNLGNTCFFNAVLQNLSQTHFLMQVLDGHLQNGQRVPLPGSLPEDYKKLLEKKSVDANSEDEDDNEVVDMKPMDVFLPEGGPLSQAFNVFLRDMQSGKKNGTINPGHLFGQICKKSLQFQGYQQQDSHELLRCLLDAIRTEEILRIKKAILKAFALNEKTDPSSVNSRLRKMIKGYGKQGSQTIIDQIFGGQLISTVYCEECQWSSQVFESFMDLSLPVNEEKGKPKNFTSSEDVNQGSQSWHGSSDLRKHAIKNHRKEEKRRNRRNKSHSSRLAAAGAKEEKEEDEEKEEKRARRLTEKRRPEDEEEYRLKEADERKELEERERRKAKTGRRKSESSKFKLLMEARTAARREEMESEDESEEQEYDQEDDEEEDSFYFLRKTKNDKKFEQDEEEVEEEEEEEEDEDEEVEEEEEEDEDGEEEETEETDSNETESDIASNVKSRSNKNVLRETSDADVEDNTDSEHERINICNATRHPSIVVDEFSTVQCGYQETPEVDTRYLRTSNSFDQLNYSSDCSERYYTAVGPDTNDELDTMNADRFSCYNTSGKGDSLSISSGTFENHRNNPKVIVDSGQIEEMCFKVGELKIHRKSSSRESLLDSVKGFKRRSTENLLYNSNERLNEDWAQHKKTVMKKLKQDWIARSLTTLAPRYQSERQECSVMSCLSNFTSPELMTGNNKVSCENCNKLRQQSGENNKPVKSNASKQLLILSPPAVLTLHLKRFSHVGFNLTKVNRYVQFPLVLDIASFTSSISVSLSNMSKGQTQLLYGLYGIVEHSGRLNSGHYVAYVRSRAVDANRTSKQMLNLKPWHQFDIDHLVAELASKNEIDKGSLNGGFRYQQSGFRPRNIENAEQEVRDGRWFLVSDTYVHEVTIEKVLKAQAYLLFYERIV